MRTAVFNQNVFPLSDLESRREVLEADLEAALRNFDLQQEELNRILEAKEQVEFELGRANEELRLIADRLEQTRQRLEEEKFLRAEHERTEEALAEQAKDLISVVNTLEADIEALYKKIERLQFLDKDNRLVLQEIPERFLAEKLKKPLELVNSLENDLFLEIQQLSSQLSKYYF